MFVPKMFSLTNSADTGDNVAYVFVAFHLVCIVPATNGFNSFRASYDGHFYIRRAVDLLKPAKVST